MGQEGEKYILSLRKHLFATPSYEITITLSILVIFLVPYLIYWDVWRAVVLFGMPYLFVNLLDYYLIKITRIYFPGRRVVTLNLLVFIIAFIQLLIFQIFLPFYLSLFLSFSFAVFFRIFVYFVFMRKKPVLGILTSLNYNIIYGLLSGYLGAEYTISFSIATVVYLITSLLVLKISVAKFVREFSEDPLWFVSSFINYLSNNDKENVRYINKFFENIYVIRKVPVSSMVFWKGNSPKTIFVFPYIHPGPFGDVGGSNITKKLRDFTELDNLMIFHTTTTHDNNVADNKDVRKIADFVKKSLKNRKRFNKMSFVKRFQIDGFEVFSQRFGKYVIIALLPTDEIFDDVDLHSGLVLRKNLLQFYDDAAMVDAHNNFDGGAFPLTLKHSDIEEIVKEVSVLKEDVPIKLGYAHKSLNGKSIGPDGIKVAVFEYEKKRIGYVLLDGNNIKRGLRVKIRDTLNEILDEVEVFSTDNHIVNYDILDLNPIGGKEDWELIISRVRETVMEALQDLEEVEVTMLTEDIEFRMARRGQLQRMTDITREALKTVKIALPVITLGGFLGALLSFLCL